MSESLYDVLRRAAEGRGERIFLRVPSQGRDWSYAEIDALAAALASVLVDVGVRPGDRVAVQVEKSAEAVALYLACLRAAAVYLPLNVAYTAAELSFALADARPALFVCRPEDEAALRECAHGAGVGHVLTLGVSGEGSLAAAAAAAGSAHQPEARGASDVAALLYTSGTTGRPKGAMLTHGGLAANARVLHAAWGFTPTDVLLHALPIFHVHGLFVALHCAMLSASEVIWLERFETAAVRAALPDATVMMGVPTFYTRLLADASFGRAECTGMRLFISGSAPLAETVFRDFEARTGHRVLERYGMTEAAILTSNPLDPRDGERVAGTVGYALPGVEARIVDARGTALAAGEVGGLEIRSPSLFAGYWGRPEATLAELRDDGFFRTGDLGWLAEDGRLTLVGRESDLVISGGYNVYPKEVELLLDEQAGVEESAVVGLPDDDLGEAVVAFVVLRDGLDAAAAEAALRAALAERIARFKQPRRFYFMAALPRNAMGKVEKQRLRRDFGGP